MTFNPERASFLVEQIKSDYELAYKELGTLMESFDPSDAKIFIGRIKDFLDVFSGVKDKLTVWEAIRSTSCRPGFTEIRAILDVQYTLLEDYIKKGAGLRAEDEFYPGDSARPENIKDCRDFKSKEGVINYWIPTKHDIKLFVKIAQSAHEKTGRTGPIRVLEIGGGSGFIGKLVADEATKQGLELEFVVTDPNLETIAKATKTYSDTKNLVFDSGYSDEVLRKYGPELAVEARINFDQLEDKKKKVLETGRKELANIKLFLEKLESEGGEQTVAINFEDIIRRFDGAELILTQAGIFVGQSYTLDQIRDKVSLFYNEQHKEYEDQILNIRNAQEEICHDPKNKPAQVDVVINSWMPLSVDFTRDIRMFGAEAIIYARARAGCTGVDISSRNMGNGLGQESSYSAGENYEEFVSWNGPTSKAVLDCIHIADSMSEEEAREIETGGYRDIREYNTSDANIFDVQLRKNSRITPEDLNIVESGDDRYSWEESLDKVVGVIEFSSGEERKKLDAMQEVFFKKK